jgi:hypothetical protein
MGRNIPTVPKPTARKPAATSKGFIIFMIKIYRFIENETIFKNGLTVSAYFSYLFREVAGEEKVRSIPVLSVVIDSSPACFFSR